MELEMEKINEFSSMQLYKIKKRQSVKNILEELGLDNRYFAVLINGKRAGPDDILEQGDEILILPKIAGGF